MDIPETQQKNPIIPRVIHYVWVGGNPLTPLAQKCIASWKKFLPDYELKLWDETNSPMNHPYVVEMYKQKKWAFVSDYIRFWALEKYGGIYLDTDMEVLKPLDQFLLNPGFLGKSKSGQVESSIIGAKPSAEFIKSALDFYDADKEFSIINTSPIVLEAVIANQSAEVKVYPASFFHPIDEGEALPNYTEAYAVHHWAESWVPFAGVRKLVRRLGLMSFFKILFKKTS